MKRIINTANAPAAIGPYSQAVEVNGTLYISGQIPLNPATGKVVEGGIKEQTRQVLTNIGAILKEAGYDFSHVVKSTCLLANMDDFKDMNEVYGEFYSQNPPARAAYGVVKLPLGALIEIETIAVKQKKFLVWEKPAGTYSLNKRLSSSNDLTSALAVFASALAVLVTVLTVFPVTLAVFITALIVQASALAVLIQQLTVFASAPTVLVAALTVLSVAFTVLVVDLMVIAKAPMVLVPARMVRVTYERVQKSV